MKKASVLFGDVDPKLFDKIYSKILPDYIVNGFRKKDRSNNKPKNKKRKK
jgi:hypothetical protein